MEYQLDLAFHSLSDPTRRAIISHLLTQKEMSAGRIAGCFASAQPTISKHLKVLKEAGLITDRKSGRQNIYLLRPGGLDGIESWLQRHSMFWAHSLDQLETYLDEEQP